MQSTAAGLIGVRQVGDRLIGTDLIAGRMLWERPAPAGDVYLSTTSRYALISVNHQSSNSFALYDLSTGRERAHSPVWGDWWSGAIPARASGSLIDPCAPSRTPVG